MPPAEWRCLPSFQQSDYSRDTPVTSKPRRIARTAFLNGPGLHETNLDDGRQGLQNPSLIAATPRSSLHGDFATVIGLSTPQSAKRDLSPFMRISAHSLRKRHFSGSVCHPACYRFSPAVQLS